MWLAKALENAFGKSPQLEPLTSIGSIMREFAQEPGGNTRGHITKRISETAGVSRREAQRYVTKHGMQTRGETILTPGNKRFDAMAAAAQVSRDNRAGTSNVPRLEYMKKRGVNIHELTGMITISGDTKRRTIRDVDIEPSELLTAFIEAWEQGETAQAQDAFELAYFDAFTFGVGSLTDADFVRRDTDIDDLDVLGGVAYEA